MLNRLIEWFGKHRSGPSGVSSNEPIARFIFSSKHFNRKTAKHAAFMPHNGELSVFRTQFLTEPEIWDIGFNHVGAMRGKQPKARADLLVSEVIDSGLNVISETSTHKLHANIIDWPNGRDDQLDIAVELANCSRLHVAPPQECPMS